MGRRSGEPVNAPLFLGSEGDPLNRDALLKLLTHAVYLPVRLGAKAGVQDCHPHRFRHTFAVNFLSHREASHRNGGNAFELQIVEIGLKSELLQSTVSGYARAHPSAVSKEPP
jgi:integrase